MTTPHLSLRQLFAVLTLAFCGLLAASALSAWTGPTATAPGGNVAAPINVGNLDQVKDAGISVDALAVFGSEYIQEKLGIGVQSPVVSMDTSGSIKIGNGGEACQAVTAGALRYNSADTAVEYCDSVSWKQIGSGMSFGAWATRTANTVYQASTDGFVSVVGLTPSGDARHCIAWGYTDSSNPPTTVRVQDGSEDNSGSGHFWAQRHGFSMPVRSGDYWKITTAGICATEVYWIPIESSGGGSSGGTTKMTNETYTKVGTASGGTTCNGIDVAIGAATDDTNKIWLTCRVVESL